MIFAVETGSRKGPFNKREEICYDRANKPERGSDSDSCFASDAFRVARITEAAASLYRSRTAFTISYVQSEIIMSCLIAKACLVSDVDIEL